MIRLLTALGLIFFHCLHLHANTITIELVNIERVKVTPGKTLTVVFKVRNQSAEDVTLVPSSSLPEGWHSLANNREILSLSKKEATALLSFQIPRNATSGVFYLTYFLTNKSNPRNYYQVIFAVEVEEVIKLSVEPLDAPSFVIAGKEIRATFTLRNLSNSTKVVSLSSNNCRIFTPENLRLGPQESTTVEVTTNTNVATSSEYSHFLWLMAIFENAPEHKVYATQNVRVIPREGMQKSERFALPFEFRVNFLGRTLPDSSLVTAYQYDVHAEGLLNKDGTKHFGLRMRGPDRFNFSSLGMYSEHYISYSTKNLKVFAGDKTYEVSKLTEYARYGRGLEFGVALKKVALGGFYMKPVFFPDIKEEYAGFINFTYKEKSNAGIGFFRKIFSNEAGVADIISLRHILALPGNTILESELASGWTARKKGNGVNFVLQSNPFKKLQLSGNYMNTGIDFPGFYTNTVNYFGTLNYQIRPNLNITLGASQNRSNGSFDTLYANSPSYGSLNAGFSYWLSSKATINFSAHRQKFEDNLILRKFNYQEDLLRLRFHVNPGKLGITLSQELGKRNDFLLAVSNPLTTSRSTINTSLNLGSQLFLETWIQSFSQMSEDIGVKRQWFFGASGNINLPTKTSLRFSLQNSYSIEEYYLNRNLLNINLSQRIGRKHELSLQTFYTLLKGELDRGDLYFMCSYALHLSLPLEPKPITQKVSGRLTDANTNPLAGVLLRFDGRTSITDSNGEYSFPAANVGSHYLLVDPSPVDLHLVPDIPNPIVLEVKLGENLRFDFSMKKAVSIFGRVEILADNSTPEIIQNGYSLGPVLLELKNGTEIHRRITDDLHKFDFSHLRPGLWKMTIPNLDTYQGITFEKSVYEFELSPGDQTEVIIKASRKKREIKFQKGLPGQLTKRE
jgi:hypothetical protein